MKKLVSSSGIALLVLVLAVSTAFAAQTTIRFAFYGNMQEFEVVKEWIKAFETANPDIKVNFETMAQGDFTTKFLTAHVAGDAPDVFRVGHAFSKNWASQGMLEPLDSFVQGPNGIDLEDFYQESLKLHTYQGTLYAIPHTMMTRALLYNKDMFDEGGLPYPTPDWTWEDFKEAAVKLTVKRGNVIVRSGFQLNHKVPGQFALFMEQLGASFYGPDGKSVNWNSPEGVEVARFWQELVTSGASPAPASAQDFGHEQAFMLGKTAMIISGPWNRPVYKAQAPNLNYGVTELPKQVTRSNNQLGEGFGIWSKSGNKEAAWRFVKFITDAPQVMLWWDMLNSHFPPRKSAIENLMARGLAQDGLAMPFIRGAEYARSDVWQAKYMEVHPILTRALEEILLPKLMKDPKEVLERTAKEANAILAQ